MELRINALGFKRSFLVVAFMLMGVRSGFSQTMPFSASPNPPALEIVVPNTEWEKDFYHILSATSLGTADYIRLRDKIVASGPVALPFLKSEVNSRDWKASWLAQILVGRIEQANDYNRWEMNLKDSRERLSRPDRPNLSAGSPDSLSPNLRKLGAPLLGLASPSILPFLIERIVWIQDQESPIEATDLGLLGNLSSLEPLAFVARTSK